MSTATKKPRTPKQRPENTYMQALKQFDLDLYEFQKIRNECMERTTRQLNVLERLYDGLPTETLNKLLTEFESAIARVIEQTEAAIEPAVAKENAANRQRKIDEAAKRFFASNPE